MEEEGAAREVPGCCGTVALSLATTRSCFGRFTTGATLGLDEDVCFSNDTTGTVDGIGTVVIFAMPAEAGETVSGGGLVRTAGAGMVM